MANTYTQLYLHFVFAVRYRKALISESFRERLEGYLATSSRQAGHYVHALYAMEDHVHLLLGYKVTDPIPDFVQRIKGGSSKWINDTKLTKGHFNWQEGYGVFSHGPDSLETVKTYILNQPEHHRKHSFQDEYRALLRRFNLDNDERYLFTSPED